MSEGGGRRRGKILCVRTRIGDGDGDGDGEGEVGLS